MKAAAPETHRSQTHAVDIGGVVVGGGAPVVVQSMTSTDTADVEATTAQTLALAEAGSELVRITVNVDAAAVAVPEIRSRLDAEGCDVPLVGDFHYNGHVLLERHPACARALAKLRINPGNVGRGGRRDPQFAAICEVARKLGKPVRIGVNGGSLDQDLLVAKMEENTERDLGMTSEQIVGECMVLSALRSTELALECGLSEEQIVISCKTSSPRDLIGVYRDLASWTRQPLHLGLTEAGMGLKGWCGRRRRCPSAGRRDRRHDSRLPDPAPRRRPSRRGPRLPGAPAGAGTARLRPSVTACPGCGRTTSTTFQELTLQVEDFIGARMPEWRIRYEGVEELKLAVMGCVVNGPGESKAADIGISLPGTGEAPTCPVYVDGRQFTTLRGTAAELSEQFTRIVAEYVESRYPVKA